MGERGDGGALGPFILVPHGLVTARAGFVTLPLGSNSSLYLIGGYTNDDCGLTPTGSAESTVLP